MVGEFRNFGLQPVSCSQLSSELDICRFQSVSKQWTVTLGYWPRSASATQQSLGYRVPVPCSANPTCGSRQATASYTPYSDYYFSPDFWPTLSDFAWVPPAPTLVRRTSWTAHLMTRCLALTCPRKADDFWGWCCRRRRGAACRRTLGSHYGDPASLEVSLLNIGSARSAYAWSLWAPGLLSWRWSPARNTGSSRIAPRMMFYSVA